MHFYAKVVLPYSALQAAIRLFVSIYFRFFHHESTHTAEIILIAFLYMVFLDQQAMLGEDEGVCMEEEKQIIAPEISGDLKA